MSRDAKTIIALIAGVLALFALSWMISESTSATTAPASAADVQRAGDARAAAKAAEKAQEEAREVAGKAARDAQDVIELAYIEAVQDDASFVKCTMRELEGRFFYRCGLGYGANGLAKVGLWEVETLDGQPVFYALNGKALAALDRIGQGVHFQPGHDRPAFDRSALDRQFEQ